MNKTTKIDAGAKIIGANGIREEADFYPTPRPVTVALLDFLNTNRIIDVGMRALEPCCGDGAISKVLYEYGFKVENHDLRVTEFGGDGIDYLTTPFKADAIITNPPFNLSQQFIEKALEEADIVAMLLKCQYWHVRKRTELFERNPPAYVLPLTWRPNFFGDKATGSSTIDFIWTVWVKGDIVTKYKLLSKPL